LPGEDDSNSNKENTERDVGMIRRAAEPRKIEPADTRSAITPPIAGSREAHQLGRQRASISEQAFVDRIRKSDRWMIGLTGAIAVGGLISAVIFGYQLREMQTASDLTREGIRISAETLIATQRPWVSIEMTILGPLTFDANGAGINIGVTLKNDGHSPAMHVRNFVTLDPDTAGHKGPDFCELQRTQTAQNFAQVLFPEDTVLDVHTARADSGEIKRAMQRTGINPLITACVDYLSEFNNIRHQTKLTANLLKKITTPGGIAAIKPNEGNVPKSDLYLEQIFGAHTAD